MTERILLVVIAIDACNALAVSAEPDAVAETSPCRIFRAKQRLSDAASWLKLDGDLRLRMDYDDARKLDKEARGHDRFWQRARFRIGATISPWNDFSFKIRAVTEPRHYCRPDLPEQLIRHEALFDRLNVKWRNAFGWPVTLTAGRQDLFLGSGWLVREGTPGDGSRTLFFDAIRLTVELKDLHTTVEGVFIDNYANSSHFIRPFNDRRLDLIEQDERGAIVYLSNTSIENWQMDGYFIYKRDHDRAVTAGTEGEIYTFGGRLKGRPADKWECSAELAGQFGHKNGRQLGAFAANTEVKHHFGDRHKNTVAAGYEYMSGSGDSNKNFDRLWGRDTQWSTVYTGRIDSIDGRAYDSSNLHRFSLAWSSAPAKDCSLETGYHLLFADATCSNATAIGVSRNGKFRGQLISGILKYRWNEHVEYRLYAGSFLPGDYYSDARNDVAVFLRSQVGLTW